MAEQATFASLGSVTPSRHSALLRGSVGRWVLTSASGRDRHVGGAPSRRARGFWGASSETRASRFRACVDGMAAETCGPLICSGSARSAGRDAVVAPDDHPGVLKGCVGRGLRLRHRLVAFLALERAAEQVME